MSKLLLPIIAANISSATGLSFIARESKHTAEISVNTHDGAYCSFATNDGNSVYGNNENWVRNSDGGPKSLWDMSICGELRSGRTGVWPLLPGDVKRFAPNWQTPSLTAYAVGGCSGELPYNGGGTCPTGSTGFDCYYCQWEPIWSVNTDHFRTYVPMMRYRCGDDGLTPIIRAAVACDSEGGPTSKDLLEWGDPTGRTGVAIWRTGWSLLPGDVRWIAPNRLNTGLTADAVGGCPGESQINNGTGIAMLADDSMQRDHLAGGKHNEVTCFTTTNSTLAKYKQTRLRKT